MQVNYAGIVPSSLASEYDDTPIAKSLASWLSIRAELDRLLPIAYAIQSLLSSDGRMDQLHLESLTWHFVLRYSRCFETGIQGRSTALGIEMVRNLGVADFVTLHDGLLHRRNFTFAHPGSDCPCRLVLHLVEANGKQTFVATLDEEAPGPIADLEQADLIIDLLRALVGPLELKIEKATNAFLGQIDREREDLLERLRSKLGKHANPSQHALALLASVRGFRPR